MFIDKLSVYNYSDLFICIFRDLIIILCKFIGDNLVPKGSCLLDKSSSLPHEAKVCMFCQIHLYL